MLSSLRLPFRLFAATPPGRQGPAAASTAGPPGTGTPGPGRPQIHQTTKAEAKAAGAFGGRGGQAGLALLLSGGAGGGTGRSYGALARAGFLANPVAHRAVRLISEAAAAVPLIAYDGAREWPDHPAPALLARPNSRSTGTDFLETLYGHLLLSGNAYVEPLALPGQSSFAPPGQGRGDGQGGGLGHGLGHGLGDGLSDGQGRLLELHLLRPDRVSPVEGADGWVIAHEYRARGVTRRIGAEARPARLLHLTLFHPLDDHLGFGPLAAASQALDLHNAATLWNKALLDNSARPSGALVYQPKEGGNLPPEQYQRLKEELEQGYAGALQAGRPLLLEGGLDWKAMSLTPRDMDFIEARNGAARDIALALGVPPMLLGIPGDNTFANYQEANRALLRLTVLPLVRRTAASLAAFLGDWFDAPFSLRPDLDQIEGLAGERDALWRRVGEASFLSDAEKREAVGYGAPD